MYCSLMVILELGRDNTRLLGVAGDIAERFGTDVMGVAACEPLKIVYASGNLPGGIVEMDDAEIKQHVQDAERQFLSILGQRHVRGLTWRASITDGASKFVLKQARCADLVVMNQRASDDAFEQLRYASANDIVMEAGHPVIVLPPQVETWHAKHIMIGWRDTRDARRAVIDAMPLLKRAEQVTVLEIAGAGALDEAAANVEDLAYWLRRHDVSAHGQAVPAIAKNGRDQLRSIADQQSVDLIVAGAYGHSRFREWAFGGVTQDLLLHATVAVLMSH